MEALQLVQILAGAPGASSLQIAEHLRAQGRFFSLHGSAGQGAAARRTAIRRGLGYERAARPLEERAAGEGAGPVARLPL